MMQISMNNGMSNPNQSPNFKKTHFGDLVVQTRERSDLRKPINEVLQKAGVDGNSNVNYPYHRHVKGENDELMIVHTKQNLQAAHAIMSDSDLNRKILNIYM